MQQTSATSASTAPYLTRGYASREAYLHALATEHKVDHASVLSLAHMLGASEDFTGLVEELEDFSQFI